MVLFCGEGFIFCGIAGKISQIIGFALQDWNKYTLFKRHFYWVINFFED